VSEEVSVSNETNGYSHEIRRVWVTDDKSAWSTGSEYLAMDTSEGEGFTGKCPSGEPNPRPTLGDISGECKEALDVILNNCKIPTFRAF